MTALPSSSPSSAVSVQGPGGKAGRLQSATTTAAITFDLTAWAGEWVKLTVHGDRHHWNLTAATAGAVTPTGNTLSAAAPALTAVDSLYDGGMEHFIVDPATPFLNIRTDTGTGFARVRRS